MNFRHILIIAILFLPVPVAVAEDFFGTSGFKFVQRKGEVSYSAEVEFPVSGNAKALQEVKTWICNVLEVDMPSRLEEYTFRETLLKAFDEYKEQVDSGTRRIEIFRSYEDEQVVTFQSLVVDRDSAEWRSEDCASLSKLDGHRIQASEIFKCSEQKIKELMWQFRNGLPVDVSSPKDLVVGDAGFIDGWIVVIGPARGYTGATYRIRYQVAEPYLRGSGRGGYY